MLKKEDYNLQLIPQSASHSTSACLHQFYRLSTQELLNCENKTALC